MAHRHGADPWRLAEALSVEVVSADLPAKAPEVLVEDGRTGSSFVLLRRGLAEADRRELLAHALGHRLLHSGDHLRPRSKFDRVTRDEREADDFAAAFLVPGSELAKLGRESDPPSVAEVADHFGVGETLVRRRGSLLALTAASMTS